MFSRWYRCCTQLVVIAFVASMLPQLALATPSAATGADVPVTQPIDEPIAPPLTVPPVVDPHLPSLTLRLAVAPNPVALGDTVAVTLTLTNQASDPAEDLLVTLPTPDGAVALSGPNTVSPARGWEWRIDRLDGPASIDLTAQLTLVRRPQGDALLLHADATADGLDLPIHDDGGALVVDRTLGAATMRYVPGTASRLRSRDGRVMVDLSARAFARALTLHHDATPRTDASAPPPIAGFHRGFGAFTLDATDDAGIRVHQFDEPLTISVSYTPEQLAALGIAEDDLTLTWYDPAAKTWQTVPTSVDPTTHTASALVNHFSDFQLGDGSSPSAAFLPSLQGFQVSTFTGAASYSFPIEAPAGPAGLKPSLELSYSSGATDGETGKRVKNQAGWAGLGWSLESGSVAANKMPNGTVYYALAVNGQSYDLMRGAALIGSPDPDNPTHWDWRPTDESFVRVRAVANGDSTATRGGFHWGIAYPRYSWQLWTKDGTRYTFSEDLWWGWHYCGETGDYAYMETYKWLLSSVTDTHGNAINYSYGRDAASAAETCFHVQGTVDRDAWPTYISWAGGKYQVNLVSSARANDTQYEGAPNQYPNANNAPHQTRRLDAIQVWANPAGTWQLVRQYNLGYDYSLGPDVMSCPSTCSAVTGYPKLTLKSIQQIGNDGTSALPATSFGYGPFSYANANGRNWVGGSWNRLTTINNGQGGVATLAYANTGRSLITA
jgi:hypothetical protein